MSHTIVLAQILGLVITISGLSLLTNKKTLAALVGEITHDKGFLWVYGFAALILGAVLIALNNLWGSGLESLVSVIGWLALLKGIMILIFPKSTASFYRKLNKEGFFALGGLVAFLVGLVLLYKGFL